MESGINREKTKHAYFLKNLKTINMLTTSYFTKKELEFFLNQTPIFSEGQMELINRKTPNNAIEEKEDKEGNKYKSVKANYVKALVNLLTGGKYSFEILSETVLSKSKEIKVHGRLTINTAQGVFFREQYGKSECNIPEGNAYKSSASECFKKCASEFGFCWDIYTQETKSKKKPSEISYSEKKELEKVELFLTEADTPEKIQHIYNTYLDTAKETEESKAILKKHMERLGLKVE